MVRKDGPYNIMQRAPGDCAALQKRLSEQPKSPPLAPDPACVTAVAESIHAELSSGRHVAGAEVQRDAEGNVLQVWDCPAEERLEAAIDAHWDALGPVDPGTDKPANLHPDFKSLPTGSTPTSLTRLASSFLGLSGACVAICPGFRHTSERS